MAEESGGVTPEPPGLPPVALVVGLTPGPMRTETCYICENPVAVSESVAADLASRARSLGYVHAHCHVNYLLRYMEANGVRPPGR